MGCPDARSVCATNGLPHEAAEVVGGNGIESGRRLVEEEQGGLEHQESGKRNPALLPEAELMTWTRQQMVDAQGHR